MTYSVRRTVYVVHYMYVSVNYMYVSCSCRLTSIVHTRVYVVLCTTLTVRGRTTHTTYLSYVVNRTHRSVYELFTVFLLHIRSRFVHCMSYIVHTTRGTMYDVQCTPRYLYRNKNWYLNYYSTILFLYYNFVFVRRTVFGVHCTNYNVRRTLYDVRVCAMML